MWVDLVIALVLSLCGVFVLLSVVERWIGYSKKWKEEEGDWFDKFE